MSWVEVCRSCLTKSLHADQGINHISAQKRLRDLKSKISAQSKRNFVLERDVRFLDSRIGLLIQNRMALDEVRCRRLLDTHSSQTIPSRDRYLSPCSRRSMKIAATWNVVAPDVQYSAGRHGEPRLSCHPGIWYL